MLKELQYLHRGPLTARHKQALAFHRDLIVALPPRQVQVVRRRHRRLVVVYSDAEYEPESGRQPRLGWVLFQPHHSPLPHPPVHPPIASSLDLPRYLTDTWGQRIQQIFPAEAVALPLATWALAEHLRGTDVIWFIDNEAAASAGIRASSGLPEVDVMVQAAHWMWMELDIRVWIEWIDSLSNPSDGLSRAGWEDAWTLRQQWQRMHVGDPPWSSDLNTPHALTRILLEDIGRR